MLVESRPIGSVKGYDRNSRAHSALQVEQIAASIREFGFNNPLLVDPDGVIIAGHGRYAAAQSLQLAEVPVIVLSHLTDAQRRAYVIADNRIALNSSWDEDLLRAELAGLKDGGFDMALLGFGDDLVDVLAPQSASEGGKTHPDDVPNVAPTPTSRQGDVWYLGSHRVICGSSTELDTIKALMGGESADVCWTDPPYNVAYSSKLAGKIKNDDMASTEFRRFLTHAFVAIASALRPGAAIYVAHADTEGQNFRAAFADAGFKLSGCLVWRKDSLVLGRSDYQWQHEPILYGWKPGAAHRWFGGRKQTTLAEWGDADPVRQLPDGRFQITVGDRVLVVTGDALIEELVPSVIHEAKPRRSADHPTMKPVALIERQLKNSARSGDIVLDAFGGSGSTLIAADRLGMRARLAELDPKFVDVIVRRWQDYTGGTATLAATGQAWADVSATRAPTAALEAA